GIHQDGVLKDRATYEILTPEAVGLSRSELVLGKHSGRHALRERIAALGLYATEEQIDQIQQRVKSLAERKLEINNEDLTALWQDVTGQRKEEADGIKLLNWQVSTGSQMGPMAQVTLQRGEELLSDSGTGNGPVHALFQAFSRALQLPFVQMLRYFLDPVSPGEDGLAVAQVDLEMNGIVVRGRAIDSDVLTASAIAMHHGFAQLSCRREAFAVAASATAKAGEN
ncbi:MAG: 2-isopropylmalate synthase, partial [Firmicutes bacterium]|nr:2-isopropylmalate synthase [Bacillota bacterium]